MKKLLLAPAVAAVLGLSIYSSVSSANTTDTPVGGALNRFEVKVTFKNNTDQAINIDSCSKNTSGDEQKGVLNFCRVENSTINPGSKATAVYAFSQENSLKGSIQIGELGNQNTNVGKISYKFGESDGSNTNNDYHFSFVNGNLAFPNGSQADMQNDCTITKDRNAHYLGVTYKYNCTFNILSTGHAK